MKIFARLDKLLQAAGFVLRPEAINPTELAIMRESLHIRCKQSRPGLIAMVLVSCSLFWTAAEQGRQQIIIFWFIPLFLSISIQALQARSILRALDKMDSRQLARATMRLRCNYVANQFFTGSAIWYVASDSHAEFAFLITMTVCLYMIGSMINLVSDFQSFRIALPFLLIHPVLFWLMRDASGRAIGIFLIILTFLVLLAARRNHAVFRESVLLRFEKEKLVEELTWQRNNVTDALNVAEAANRSKTFFLAAASHDLRQPMFAISLLNDSLKMAPDPQSRSTMLSRQRQAIDLLRHQLDNLLDVSRFDSGQIKPKLENIGLNNILKLLELEFSGIADAKGLAIEIPSTQLVILSDAELLTRLLSNLLSNAIKYTSRGTVSIALIEQGDTCHLEVRDSGPGIPAHEQERIFEIFVQLDNPSRTPNKGFGMGLAIVKHIDTLLQCRLHINHSSGAGTVFSMQFPLVRQMEELDTPAEKDQPNPYFPGNPIVWIIEDDDFVSNALLANLSLLGCMPYIASCWSQILELRQCIGRWPDACIIDDMLANNENGLAIANSLADSVSPGSILICTGNQLESRLNILWGSGFAVLRKPIKVEQLHMWLSEALINTDPADLQHSPK